MMSRDFATQELKWLDLGDKRRNARAVKILAAVMEKPAGTVTDVYPKGAGRTAARHVAGLIEILTFPFPIWHDSYQPLLPSEIPYIHGGYAEFPPEVGNESKYPYVRDTHHDFN